MTAYMWLGFGAVCAVIGILTFLLVMYLHHQWHSLTWRRKERNKHRERPLVPREVRRFTVEFTSDMETSRGYWTVYGFDHLDTKLGTWETGEHPMTAIRYWIGKNADTSNPYGSYMKKEV